MAKTHEKRHSAKPDPQTSAVSDDEANAVRGGGTSVGNPGKNTGAIDPNAPRRLAVELMFDD